MDIRIKYENYIQIGDKAMKRKIAILKAFYNHVYRKRLIHDNISFFLEIPKHTCQ